MSHRTHNQSFESHLASHRKPRAGAASLLLASACLPLGGCVVSVGGGTKFEQREEISLAERGGASTLVVKNSVGEVVVEGAQPGSDIAVRAVMIGKGRSQEDAAAALDEIEVTLEASASDPSVIEARSTHPRGSNRKNYEVEWRITAPEGMAIRVFNDVGEVTVNGFQGPIAVQNDVGDVEVRGGGGGATIKTSVGDVDMASATPIDVRTDVGEATVRVVGASQGPIAVMTDVGGIELTLPSAWAGVLDAKTDTGDVDIALPAGLVNLSKRGRTHVQGTLGAGGAPIMLVSDVGDIDIEADESR